MAFEESGPERKMFKGDWSCSGCGKSITELPFEPDPNRSSSLKCLDCYKSSKPARSGGGERKMFQGAWTCGSCGAAITELPFEPNPNGLGNLKCRDCFRGGQA